MTAFHYLPGLGLAEEQLAAFQRYRDMLLDWNSRVNLTAITEPLEVEVKHFLDSLLLRECRIWREAGAGAVAVAGAGAGAVADAGAGAVAGAVADAGAGAIHTVSAAPTASAPPGRLCRAADVGSGAGLPGLPLKLCGESIALDMFDASGKRVKFLQAAVADLELKNVRAFHLRAEEAGRNPAYRESYDWVFSRAVAALPVLLEYCLPLLRAGGYMAAYKGPLGAGEAEAAKKTAALLGGGLAEVFEASLPLEQGERCILIYQKLRPTPKKYPRRPGLPAKEPLA